MGSFDKKAEMLEHLARAVACAVPDTQVDMQLLGRGECVRLEINGHVSRVNTAYDSPLGVFVDVCCALDEAGVLG